MIVFKLINILSLCQGIEIQEENFITSKCYVNDEKMCSFKKKIITECKYSRFS